MRRSRKLPLWFGWALLSALAAALLLDAQRGSESKIRQRFQDRVTLAADLTQTYTRDLLAQERRVAVLELGRDDGSPRGFRRVARLFGQEAALLLDSRGRVLQVLPAKASLVGRDLTGEYAHLRGAVAGRPTVSNVVPSAANRSPVVAFATPIDTPRGRRVYSGAFDLDTTPIAAYIRSAVALTGARTYLLDATGTIVASSRDDVVGVTTLAQIDPDLAGEFARTAAARTPGGYEFVSSPVRGTPWRIVISVPAAGLYRPIQGARRTLPWVVWITAVLAGLVAVLLLGRLVSSRAELATANAGLSRLARTDALTGLENRRQAQMSLDAAVDAARRDGGALSVLLIDVDRFKDVNDRHGHAVGDEVLRFVAGVVRQSLGEDDHVGRWGGEEFLVILPGSDGASARQAAEHIRAAVARTPFVVRDARDMIPISVSIGAASGTGDGGLSLVAQADVAMYAAKAAGRNRVRVAA